MVVPEPVPDALIDLHVMVHAEIGEGAFHPDGGATPLQQQGDRRRCAAGDRRDLRGRGDARPDALKARSGTATEAAGRGGFDPRASCRRCRSVSGAAMSLTLSLKWRGIGGRTIASDEVGALQRRLALR